MASSVNAGANEVKRANFGSKLEQWKAVHENGWSIATSPRRDVTTSRRWVNHCKSQQAVMSRCLNVATSQRRDVSTSRRCNVATSARNLPSIIKSKKGSEYEASGGVRPRARKSRAAATPISKKSPRFELFPIFGQ